MADSAAQSDADLVAAVRGGRREGLEELVARYQKPIYNLVLRMLGDPERARDVFQDVFLGVMRNLPSFQQGRSFRNWIFGVAVNLCRNELRARKVQTGLDAERRPSSEADPAEAAEKSELAEVVRAGVGELSHDHREVFVLRMYHGLSYAEIGEVLKISEGTAKSRMHYAVNGLRRKLRRHRED